MDASTSSQGSYILINHHNHSTQLHPYFPLLAQPARFTAHQQQLEQVQQLRQQQPDKQLFIDHLLTLAAPPGSVSYPPTSHSDLTSLISALSISPLNPLTARSCLYYLALTFSSPALAASYAKDHLLPTAFRLSVRAFHALDNGNYSLGVKLLSDPRVTPDFIPRTFALVDTLPEAKDRAQLVLSYWRLAGIKLEDQTKEEVKVVVRALCADGRKHGANEAWLLAREWHVESEREELAKTVLAVCFGDNPTRLPLAQHLSTLLARPFTPTEDALSTSFCAAPPSSLNPTLTADWRLSKLIAESRPVDALRFWATVKRNGNKRVEPSDQRDRLLAAVEANLTSIQKTTLSLEMSSAPAPSATTTTSSTQPAANITQPAWAPLPPTTSSSSVPIPPAVAPPRTLAAARLAQLPPPPPPQPRAEDLPLSASPFVRNGPAAAGGASGVLKALDAATPRKASQPGFATGMAGFAASPARINGSPFAFPPPSTAGSTVGGGAPSTVGTGGGGAGSVVELPASPAKPTLAGFGSVRQLPPPHQSPAQVQQQATPKATGRRETSSRRFIPQEQPQESEDEDEDGDAAMAVDDEQQPSQQQPQQAEEGEEEDNEEQEQDYDFAVRAALDPAIAATIAAAEKKPSSTVPTASSKTPSKRVSGGASARSTRTRERGDKRRAVSLEPAEEREGEKGKGKTPARGKEGRTSGRRATKREGREKPDEGKTVKLPPGAFPGEEEEEEDEQEEEQPASPPTTRRSSRSTQSQAQKTPARRSTRGGSRQSTVDPPSPAESTTSTATAPRGARTTRRSTRASSLAPSEAGDEEDGEEGEKPKTTRRSSRLSSDAGKTPTAAGRRTTRSGRRTGRIEEEE